MKFDNFSFKPPFLLLKRMFLYDEVDAPYFLAEFWSGINSQKWIFLFQLFYWQILLS